MKDEVSFHVCQQFFACDHFSTCILGMFCVVSILVLEVAVFCIFFFFFRWSCSKAWKLQIKERVHKTGHSWRVADLNSQH